MYLIGYDIGSSSIEAAIIETTRNQEIAVVQYPDAKVDMTFRQSEWAKQQPETWWQNVYITTRKQLTETRIIHVIKTG